MSNIRQIDPVRLEGGDVIVAHFPQRLPEIASLTGIEPLRRQNDFQARSVAYVQLPSGKICGLVDDDWLASMGKPRTSLTFSKADVAKHGVAALVEEALTTFATPELTPSWVGGEAEVNASRSSLGLERPSLQVAATGFRRG